MMSFITYNKNYYYNFLQNIENSIPTKENIYLAKQLLKMVEDFEDEGYTDLKESIQEFNGKDRLKRYIENNNEKPFEVVSIKRDKISYNNNQELSELINNLLNLKKDYITNDFINELISFTNSIEVEDDTAYIFLLRDTLIPYLIFKNKHVKNINAYMIGRKMLEDISGIKNVDDLIRKPIIEALEKDINNYKDFDSYVTSKIKDTLNNIKSISSSIKPLLEVIKCKKIMVIESGVFGTIPFLLKALDSRVDFKMYTTVPYLKDIYKDKIFTEEYEKSRKFETLASQDLYFIYDSFKDNKFYVKVSNNKEIKDRVISEISQVLAK